MKRRVEAVRGLLMLHDFLQEDNSVSLEANAFVQYQDCNDWRADPIVTISFGKSLKFRGEFFAEDHHCQFGEPMLWTTFPKAEWKSHQLRCLRTAAQHTLSQAIDTMLTDSRRILALELTDDGSGYKLKPQHSISTPWQAIGSALVKRVCSETFTQRFCVRCQAPIAGRADQVYCQKAACRQWGYRNNGKVRK
jgi:hypothetical protein